MICCGRYQMSLLNWRIIYWRIYFVVYQEKDIWEANLGLAPLAKVGETDFFFCTRKSHAHCL